MAEHAQAITSGQTEVEHDGIIRFELAEDFSVRAVATQINGESGLFQRAFERWTQAEIVFD
jgi:hypothetical protein